MGKVGIGWKELLKVWYKTKWQVGTESNFVLELCARRTRVVIKVHLKERKLALGWL
jgi:hypothetical protein